MSSGVIAPPVSEAPSGYVIGMQAFAFLVVAIVAAFIVAIAVGLAWFLAVPAAILLLLLPVAFATHMFSQRRSHPSPSDGPGVPSTQDAAYRPIADPAKPGTTPR